MNDARTLLHLQNLDVEVETCEAALADVEANLGDSPELLAARDACESARRTLDALRARQRDLEYEVDSLTARIAAEEKQMYDGRGRGARELEGLRRSVDALKAHRSEVEDRILDTMGAIEQAQVELATAEAELERVETAWRASQGDLLGRRDEIRAQLAKAKARRNHLASTLDRAVNARYEDLRQQKRGRERNRVKPPVLGNEPIPAPGAGRLQLIP